MRSKVFWVGLPPSVLRSSWRGTLFGPFEHRAARTPVLTGDDSTAASLVTVLVIPAVYFMPPLIAHLASKTDLAELELRLIKWVIGVGIAASLAMGGMIWTATQILLRAHP
jgi:hypothetical protein